MDRLLTVEAVTRTFTPAGSPVETWSTVATLRAELMSNRLAEDERGSGAVDDAHLVFRSWFLDGITLDNRVTYAGQAFEIRGLAEIGRRRGLEITARRIGP